MENDNEFGWEGQPPDAGFFLNENGLFEIKNGKKELVSAPVRVSCLTKGGRGWGRTLEFLDHDGETVELSISASLLYDKSALISLLVDSGLKIRNGQERRLIAYLAASLPIKRTYWNDEDVSNNADDLIIENIRAFLIKNSSRFQNVLDGIRDIPNRAGFFSESAKQWFFSKEALAEAAGEDAVKAARILKNAGFLFTNDNGLKSVAKTPLGRGRWYCVFRKIIEEA